LGVLRDIRAVSALSNLLEHSNPTIVATAKDALSKFEPETDVL
jgi:HEAT repeat protein